MPVLPIVDAAGQLVPKAQEIVLAVTTYPDDLEKVAELVASIYVTKLLQEKPESTPPFAQLFGPASCIEKTV
jgi:hypothetical protein